VPQAVGAQAAYPGRQVVTLSGDGGVSMMLGDLLTLKQMNLPVKVVVFSNGTLGFVELEMKASGFVDFGCSLENPDFAQLVAGAGMLGRRVEKPEGLRPALEATFAHDGPALVEVLVNRQELSMPPTITLEQAKGFTLYMMKAVMSGRGDEVLDLAQTNLLR
jgi:pyruvate dehydrogenase (quinone)